jgi:hypothetical protein
MKPKNVAILAVVTLIIALAAVFSARDGVGASTQSAERGPLFPNLTERINDVDQLVVTTKDGTFQVTKAGDVWGLSDRGGYPVDPSKVREVLVGITRFEKIEPKTSNPEKFADLGVDDPDNVDSQATRVELKAADKVVAAVVVGKQRVAKSSVGERTMYVRPAGDERAWEVTGNIRVEGVAKNWLDRKILELDGTRVRRVDVTHADGEKLSVYKDNPEDTNFKVEGLPEGAALKWDGVASAVGRALQYLNLDDVRPVEEVNFDEGSLGTAEFSTFEGLVINVRLAKKDDLTYARFEAAFDPARRLEPPPPADASAVDGDGVTEGDAAAGAPDSPEGDAAAGEVPGEVKEPEKPPMATPEEVTAEAAELNQKLQKWAYAIPSYTAQNFTKRMTDMIKSPEEEAALQEPTGLEEENLDDMLQLEEVLDSEDKEDSEVVPPESVDDGRSN